MLHHIKNYLKKIRRSQGTSPIQPNATTCDFITRIRSQRLTYLSDARLFSIANTCRAIEQRGIPGIFVEAGCALGGSAILVASTKHTMRPFFIYDVFGTIPAPTKEDTQDVHDRYRVIVEGKSLGINGDKYYGYEDNLYDTVISNLKKFGITCEEQSIVLVKGLIHNTMKIDQSVAFAHIDVDWYEPVKTCLIRIFPQLIIGGSIIVDDYHDWGGCRKAVDEYLQTTSGELLLDDSAGSLKITKVRN